MIYRQIIIRIQFFIPHYWRIYYLKLD